MKNILLLSACTEEHPNCEEINGHKIYNTGIGKVNAAITTTKLLIELKPYIIINFGSCGRLKLDPIKYKDSEVFNISCVQSDLDITDIDDSYDTVLPLYDFPFYEPSMIACLTTDIFHNPNKTYPKFHSNLIKICDVVDMELYAIAQACKTFEKPLYSFKWISDSGNGQDWKKNAAIGFEKFKKIFIENFL